MMEMVNGSRFGVALMGLGIHRRSFLESAIYAAHREQWGQRIDRYPMVRETLVDLLVTLEAGLALTFECAAATRTAADEHEGRLLRRILVPLAKVRATRDGLGAAIQGVEILGGNGYMEDWPMARQLRDAQCHTIWEGTENICSLDVRRAIRRDGADVALLARIERALGGADRVARARARRRRGGHHPRRGTRRASRTSPTRPPTSSSSTPDGSRTCSPTSPRARSSSTRPRGRSHATATPARPSSPRGSPASGCRPGRARGILDDDRTVLDHFDAVVRYGAIDPADAA